MTPAIEVPRGEPGEICARGPLVMKGYWNKPEETAAALQGGWLHTGDVAREDEHGFYTIVDRKKDMIVSGGFNVFPREIEDVLSTHPAVAAAAVIGVPDEKWGEAVKAVVVLRPGADRRGRGPDRPGPGAQGLALRAEVRRRRRQHPADRGRQAGQEGAPRPVLGRRRPPGRLRPGCARPQSSTCCRLSAFLGQNRTASSTRSSRSAGGYGWCTCSWSASSSSNTSGAMPMHTPFASHRS